jgi:hypothetical protein
MRKLMILLVSAVIFVPALASAERVQVLNWSDLVPKFKPIKNPLRHLDVKLRYDIEYLASIRYWVKTRQISKVDVEYEQGAELEHKLKTQKVEYEPQIAKFNAFLDEIDRRNKSIVKELDGKLVRIPGFALPLETTSDALDEFLLVPTIGACIHTPVPPSNQMVFVKLKQSYKAKKLYEPVWITGKMKIENAKQKVLYSDGEVGIEAAYTIQGTNIEPYETN